MQTLRNVSAYNEPTWHFDAQFVDKQEHARVDAQKASGHGHFLEMENAAYHCPYDFADKVNAIYIVYEIRDYDGIGTDNHRGVCFLEDE